MNSKGYGIYRGSVTGLALTLGGMLLAQSALACTANLWNGGVTGTVTAAQPNSSIDPDPPTIDVPRYSGTCGMQVDETGVNYVQDNSPGGINRIVARFYVLANNDATATIYRGQNGSGGELFNVTLAADGTVTLNSGSASPSAAGTPNAWNSVEIDWDAGTGNLSLIVNGGTPQTATFSSAGGLASVQVGNLVNNSGTGALVFDSYESRRSTAIGRLVRGDANADGAVTVFDFIAVVNESSGTGALAIGQPDCNEDGAVTVFDAICVVNLAAGP